MWLSFFMKITTVSYQRMYSVGLYLNERIGLEAQIDENEDASSVISRLKVLVDQQHRIMNPHLDHEISSVDVMKARVEVAQHQEKEQQTIEQMLIQDIQTCKSLSELKTYRMVAQQRDKTLNAYNEKLKEFEHAAV